MSRIGNQPIPITEGVTLSQADGVITANGPKGKQSVTLPAGITFSQEGEHALVKRKNDEAQSKALHGLARSLVFNAVKGVTEGFTKTLEIKGVGYRAKIAGDTLVLTVGFSHLVEIKQPEGIKFEVKGPNIIVSGIDKQFVGEVAAKIRRVRPPDAYKGKGIRYQGEYVRIKPGKAAKAAAA